MLFSCLVDADFLDTEMFMDKKRHAKRGERYPDLKRLLGCLDSYMDQLCKEAAQSPINAIRADILQQCREAAHKEPAVFSLSVPTGGGKTLSSLSFALHHAVQHKLKNGNSRIIYVIPYTSIIEQTAEVFRRIPGFENTVIEHHSNVAEADETQETARSRLAAENWDAPIIVTTSVQFFESLFACRRLTCGQSPLRSVSFSDITTSPRCYALPPSRS